MSCFQLVNNLFYYEFPGNLLSIGEVVQVPKLHVPVIFLPLKLSSEALRQDCQGLLALKAPRQEALIRNLYSELRKKKTEK